MNVKDAKRPRCMQCSSVQYLSNEPNTDHEVLRMPMAHSQGNQGDKTSSKVN